LLKGGRGGKKRGSQAQKNNFRGAALGAGKKNEKACGAEIRIGERDDRRS